MKTLFSELPGNITFFKASTVLFSIVKYSGDDDKLTFFWPYNLLLLPPLVNLPLYHLRLLFLLLPLKKERRKQLWHSSLSLSLSLSQSLSLSLFRSREHSAWTKWRYSQAADNLTKGKKATNFEKYELFCNILATELWRFILNSLDFIKKGFDICFTVQNHTNLTVESGYT